MSLTDQKMEMYLINIENTYAKCFVLKFLGILSIVYIGAELMKLCLVSRARNLVLFCFYFSTTAIAEDVCYSQCEIQVTVGLILTKKI